MWAFFLRNLSDSWPHHQKHMVKSPIWGAFCIWCGSGDDLWERCLLKLPGLLDASWVPPGCLLGASWVLPGCLLPNTRMSLPKIQEPPLNPLGKQIIMKWVYYKWKMQIRFYPQNLNPTGRYHCKSTFLPKTWYRVLFRPVILPLAVWPHHKRRGRFRQKTSQYKRLVLPQIKDFQVLGEKVGPFPKMKWWIMMPDIISSHWNALNLLFY